jgi:hypothetical protein
MGSKVEINTILFLWWVYWGAKTWAFEGWRYPQIAETLKVLDDAVRELKCNQFNPVFESTTIEEMRSEVRKRRATVAAISAEVGSCRSQGMYRNQLSQSELDRLRECCLSSAISETLRVRAEFMVEANLAVIRGESGITDARLRYWRLNQLMEDTTPIPWERRAHTYDENSYGWSYEDWLAELIRREWISRLVDEGDPTSASASPFERFIDPSAFQRWKKDLENRVLTEEDRSLLRWYLSHMDGELLWCAHLIKAMLERE